jgi:photosystem II protein
MQALTPQAATTAASARRAGAGARCTAGACLFLRASHTCGKRRCHRLPADAPRHAPRDRAGAARATLPAAAPLRAAASASLSSCRPAFPAAAAASRASRRPSGRAASLRCAASNTSMQFVKGVSESAVPDVKLTRARDGSSGTAIFFFESPDVFDAANEGAGEITGLYLVDEEGTLSTVDVSAKFVNGKPKGIEAKYTMRSAFEWDRFMRFMERYAEDHGAQRTAACALVCVLALRDSAWRARARRAMWVRGFARADAWWAFACAQAWASARRRASRRERPGRAGSARAGGRRRAAAARPRAPRLMSGARAAATSARARVVAAQPHEGETRQRTTTNQ